MAKQLVSSNMKAESKTLKDRLNKATQQSKPNLMPQDPPPPPQKEEEEPIPDMTEVVYDKADQMRLQSLIGDYLVWQSAAKEAGDEKDKISAQIKQIVGTYELSKLTVNGNLVNYFDSPRKTIKAELLLQHNVSPRVIQECTQVTHSYTLRITKQG